MTPETPLAAATTLPAHAPAADALANTGARTGEPPVPEAASPGLTRAGARQVRLPRLKTSLARRFLLANLAILAVGGLAIGVWVGDQLERGIVNRTASITALYVESFIEPSLGSLATGDRLGPADIEQLDGLLTGTALGDRIVALRVWGRGGTIVYSPDAALIGLQFPVRGGLAEAWDGQIAAEMSDLSSAENAPERAHWDRLLEMYVPVRERGGERIIAVAEFYQLPTDIDTEVADARLWSWAIVAAAILLSVALLYGIVKQGSDTIASQEAALTRQVGELSELLGRNEALSERVRAAAERTTTIGERSLRRISSELHDGPGQMLSLALMRLDALRDRAANGTPAGSAEIAEVQAALQDAMKDMRSIAAGLRMPELAPLSIADVARRAVHDHERRTGIPVALDVGSLPPSVALSLKITFFRALQELLSNATRHGGGASIRVSVEARHDTLDLEVADKGPGFDPAILAQSAGLGLPGMREQAELLGGGFAIVASPGRGATVRVWWPLRAARPTSRRTST